jgi:hypothetical protein
MKIQPLNLEIYDTCLVLKTWHGQYEATCTFMDQAQVKTGTCWNRLVL